MDNFKGESSLGTYLTRIAINQSLKALKRRQSWARRFFSRDDDEIVVEETAHRRKPNHRPVGSPRARPGGPAKAEPGAPRRRGAAHAGGLLNQRDGGAARRPGGNRHVAALAGLDQPGRPAPAYSTNPLTGF